MVAGAVDVYNYKEDKLPELFCKAFEMSHLHFKIQNKLYDIAIEFFFHTVKYMILRFYLNEHVKLLNGFPCDKTYLS